MRWNSGSASLYWLHVLRMAGHQHAHEVLGVAVARVAVDDISGRVFVVEVADRALDEAAFLIDQRGRVRFQRQLAHRVPQAQQIFVVALDLDLGAIGAAVRMMRPMPSAVRGDCARSFRRLRSWRW
jgi:hypothetical protein